MAAGLLSQCAAKPMFKVSSSDELRSCFSLFSDAQSMMLEASSKVARSKLLTYSATSWNKIGFPGAVL
jgi:hypothetical protein